MTNNDAQISGDLAANKSQEMVVDMDANQTAEISLTVEMMRFYAKQAANRKNKIDVIAAEIQQRQDKMRLINDIIASINHITDEKNSIDISKDPDLMEKLQVARDLGIKIKAEQTQFDSIGRTRLIDNLHLSADSWDKENRHQTQKMEIHIKDLDRILILLKDVEKKEDQAKRPMIAGMKGG